MVWNTEFHGVRFEVVEGDNTCDCRREGGRNLRIAHIGNMPDARDIEVVNLGLECVVHLTRGAREVDRSGTY